jgi:hypothetical protein
MNSKKLGQRKNCNLPGVLVDLPVLGPKDVDDVQNFAAKNGMDFVAASFVQSADDVRWVSVGGGVLGMGCVCRGRGPWEVLATTAGLYSDTWTVQDTGGAGGSARAGAQGCE